MKTPQGVGCYGANERTRSEGVGCGGWGFWYWRKENVPYLLQAKKKKKDYTWKVGCVEHLELPFSFEQDLSCGDGGTATVSFSGV